MPCLRKQKKTKAFQDTTGKRLQFNTQKQSSQMMQLQSMLNKTLTTKKQLMHINEGIAVVMEETMTHAAQLSSKIASCNNILQEIQHLMHLQEILDSA
jgi:hypothetical protein